MRAARFHTAGDVRIEDVPAPGAVAARELLVRVRECGICGTDLHEYRHGPIQTRRQPHPRTGAGTSSMRTSPAVWKRAALMSDIDLTWP